MKRVTIDRIVCYSCMGLFFMPMYMALPAMQEYIIMRRCKDLNMNPQMSIACDSPEVNASASSWYMWSMLSCNLPTLVVAIPLGRMADSIGRRKVLIWNTATQCFGSLGMMLVCLMELDLLWYIPFYVVNGLGGGSYVLLLILLASLIDTTREEREESAEKENSGEEDERTRQIRICTGLYYLCGAMGPLAGGYLTQDLGHIFRSSSSGDHSGSNETSSDMRLTQSMDDDFIHSVGRTVCMFCHGGNYQLAHLFFFVTNAALVLLALVGVRETSPACKESKADENGKDVDSANDTDHRSSGGSGGSSSGNSNSIGGSSGGSGSDLWGSTASLLFGSLALLRSPRILRLSLIYALLYAGISCGLNDIAISYAKLDRFAMSDSSVGWLIGLAWTARALSIFVLMPLLMSTLAPASATADRAAALGEAANGEAALGEGKQGRAAPLLDPAEAAEHESSYRNPAAGNGNGSGEAHELALVRTLQAGAAVAAVAVVGMSFARSQTQLFIITTLGGLVRSCWPKQMLFVCSFSRSQHATYLPVYTAYQDAIWDSAGSALFAEFGEQCIEQQQAEEQEAHRRQESSAGAGTGTGVGAGGLEGRAAMTKVTGQGDVMALRCFVSTLMSVLAPLVWRNLYAATVGWQVVCMNGLSVGHHTLVKFLGVTTYIDSQPGFALWIIAFVLFVTLLMTALLVTSAKDGDNSSGGILNHQNQLACFVAHEDGGGLSQHDKQAI